MNVCKMHRLKSVKRINISYYGLSIIIVYAVYFSITAFLSAKLNVWTDEIYSLMTTSGGFSDALHNAIYEEFQAPLYFLILWCWRQINDSIFFARLLSIIFGLAAIEVFRREISRLIGRTYWVVLCAVLFLSNYVFIEFSVDIRRYTLEIFLSSLSCSLFINCYLSSNLSLLARISYLLCSLMGIYCDYYFGFLLAGHFATLIFSFNWRNFKSYLIDMTLFSFACIPLLFMLSIHMELMATDLKSTSGHFINNVDSIFSGLERYIIPFNRLIESRLLRWSVRGIFIIFSLIAICKMRIWYPYKNSILRYYVLILISLVLIFIFIVANISSSYFLGYRHFVVIYSMLILIFCSLLFLISRKYPYSILIMIVMLISYGIALCITYKSFVKPGNYIAIAEYLHKNELPNEKLYVYPHIASCGLRIYYHGINPILSLKENKNFKWEPQSEYIQTEGELQKIFMNINTKENFRLVTFCLDNELYNTKCNLLDEYMKKFNSVRKVYFDDAGIIVLYEKDRN
jgi:hypothetical protein